MTETRPRQRGAASQKSKKAEPAKVPTKEEPTEDSPRSTREDMVKVINIRIPLPIAIPLLALLGLGLVAFLFALFLLRLPQAHAPAVALALALNILAATTFAATRPHLSAATIAELAVLVVYPVALAVILVNLGVGGLSTQEAATEVTPKEAATQATSEAAAPVSVPLSADGLQYSTDELELPAGQEVILAFENEDFAPHNFAVYEDESLEGVLFQGENVEPGASVDYEIDPLEPGTYYFRCDIHPSMDGRLIAA